MISRSTSSRWAILVTLSICLAVAGCSSASKSSIAIPGGANRVSTGNGEDTTALSNKSASLALNDVRITRCTTGQIVNDKYMGAELDVTNHSSGTSSYIIGVAFESPDGTTLLDTGSGVIDAVAPGQSEHAVATSLKSPPPGRFICKVASVDRSASSPSTSTEPQAVNASTDCTSISADAASKAIGLPVTLTVDPYVGCTYTVGRGMSDLAGSSNGGAIVYAGWSNKPWEPSPEGATPISGLGADAWFLGDQLNIDLGGKWFYVNTSSFEGANLPVCKAFAQVAITHAAQE